MFSLYTYFLTYNSEGMNRIVDDLLCIRCKGYKKLCGLPKCPFLEMARSHYNTYISIRGDRVYGSTPPSLLVGEYSYPRVRVMLNVPPNIYGDDARIYDAPREWWGRYSLEKIINLRTSLLSSVVRIDVHDPWILYENEVSLSAVSIKPVDSEVKLSEKPKVSLRFSSFIKPIGLSADAKEIKITSNPVLDSLMEKRIFDDLKASQAVVELYNYGHDIYTLIHALSGGLLGDMKNRRIVPTRWAITAIDSILGSYFRRRIMHYPYINEIYAFSGEYLDNKFLVMLYPGPLELEWMEAWHPRSLWVKNSSMPSILTLYEDPRGRYDFMDGGYMAARFSVLEYLNKIRRQATVFIYREVKPEYYAPVGNWHIRETVRHIMKNNPRKYQTLKNAFNAELKYFDIPRERWIKSSKLLKEIRERRTILEYMKK